MKIKSLVLGFLVWMCFLPGAVSAFTDSGPLTLDQCIELALEQNQQRRISQMGVETAEAQLKQALSAYWPRLSFESAYTQLDEETNFIFPRETSQYTITTPTLAGPMTVTSTVTVPEKDVQVMKRDNIVSRLQMVYPLCTGGLRGAVVDQARAGLEAARQVHRRSALQLIYDVQRMYYGAILAQRLSKIGEDTLARLQATVELTEMLYKSGSQAVSKRDYLRSKVILESARSIVTLMQSNVELAKSALANTMGMAWDTPVELAEDQIPYTPFEVDLNQMVSGAYRFNPDWKQLEAAVKAYEAKVSEEKAGHWPKIGLTGTLWRWDNNLENSGMATDDNEQGWSVGVGMSVPLFSGFLTTNKVRAARAQLSAMQARQVLFKGGLALQIKHAFLQMAHARKVRESTQLAADTASQNRDLTEKAYRLELVGADDMIESQVMESLTQARAEESRYSHAAAQYLLAYLVGTQLENMLQ